MRQTGRSKKSWWDYVKDDMESLGLTEKDAHLCSLVINGGECKGGNRLTQVHLEMAVKTVYLCLQCSNC